MDRETLASPSTLGFGLITLAVFLSMLSGWEMSTETWGYWFFSRILAETGCFVIPGRSPIYTIYLNAFRWIGYPGCTFAEYVITMLLTVVAAWAFLSPYVGLLPSLVVTVAWIPFLQFSEPPVQSLAMACACCAMILRRGQPSAGMRARSYALFWLSGMFRITNLVFIIAFLARDLFAWRTRQSRVIYKAARSRRAVFEFGPAMALAAWPLIVLVGLTILVHFRQSTHPSNNAYFADTRWFPVSGKSLAEASIIQYINWHFIETQAAQGTLSVDSADFYFTNETLFGKARTLAEAFRENPQLILQHVARNLTTFIPVSLSVTLLPEIIPGLKLNPLLAAIVYAVILYGLWLAVRQNVDLQTFSLASLGTVGVTALTLVQERYMIAWLPLLALSAAGLTSAAVLTPRSRATARILVLCLLSPVALWSHPLEGFAELLCGHPCPLLQTRGVIGNTFQKSMRAAYPSLRSLAPECQRGVLSLEHTFVGAFLDVPLSSVEDVWQFPPFGKLGDGGFDGLTPDRVGCVLVSRELASHFGWATNPRPRFRGHIAPFNDILIDSGAKVVEIPSYGWAIIAPQK